MVDYNLEKRRFIIGGIAMGIVIIYIVRLFTLQLLSDDYKKNADSNAFLKKVDFPSRGVIYDRSGKLLVYNQPSYDIMVVMNEESGRLDTMEFCNAIGITKEFFIKRMINSLVYSESVCLDSQDSTFKSEVYAFINTLTQLMYWEMWQKRLQVISNQTIIINQVTT